MDKEKKKKQQLKVLDHIYSEKLEDTCDILLESLNDGRHSKFESWELFEARKKQEFKDRIDSFKRRFGEGYKVLMEEVIHEVTREKN